jgi:glycosyltransferase involved in cell wall biosynthesis
VIAVSESLAKWAESAGLHRGRVHVVGNGVDTDRFAPLDREWARQDLGLPAAGPVLVTVGGLTERKGFHRVIECLPQLRERWPGLQYLICGGASGEGDWRQRLEYQVDQLDLRDCVHFLGMIEPERLKEPLSAADAFVLATRNEGWANVLLEAMACGVPVVTTDVGGNRQVVSDEQVGLIVPFGDPKALMDGIDRALSRNWDRQLIRSYAEANGWATRIETLVRLLESASGSHNESRVTAGREGAP